MEKESVDSEPRGNIVKKQIEYTFGDRAGKPIEIIHKDSIKFVVNKPNKPLEPFEELCEFVLDKLQSQELYRWKDRCVHRAYVSFNDDVTFEQLQDIYSPYQSVEKTIQLMFNKDKDFDPKWKPLVEKPKGLKKLVSRILSVNEDPRFPRVSPPTDLFAFQNGTYSLCYSWFFNCTSNPEKYQMISEREIPATFYQTEPGCKKYHPSTWDLMKVPIIDDILVVQRFTKQNILLFYAILGLLITPIERRKDGFPFRNLLLQGIGSSGKSTIFKAISILLGSDYQITSTGGELRNPPEPQQTVLAADLTDLAPLLKSLKDFKGSFLASSKSGMDFNQPGVHKHASGILVCYFLQSIPDPKPVGQDIKSCVGALLLKSNLAYKHLAKAFDDYIVANPLDYCMVGEVFSLLK